MKTRTKKSTNAVNSLKSKDKSTRKPLSDKTNDANPSNNMKCKKNEKQPTIVTNKIGIRQSQRNPVKNSVKSDSTKKNESGNSNVLISKNEHKLKNNTKTCKSDSSKLNNFNKTQQEQKNIKNVENTQTGLSVKRRSSRISTVTSNKNSSNLREKPQQIKEIKKNATTPLKSKRLLDCLKTPSPENSDPYEFKFDPKEEPKQKLKKRGRAKKYVSSDTSESSDEEDNSMKPIVKNIRKNKQKIRVTPVERKLRNRLIKIDDQAGLIQQTNINNIENSGKTHNADVIEINKQMIELNTKENEVINTDAIELNAKSINTSIVDEINEIANTFLEDDDNNISISSPSRIDIISNLIARKTMTKPSTKVFNSTMIHETPQQPQTQSPWRIEVSAISRKPLNFCVKNKSFTPSYTPDITNNKKQTTLLDFINRTPNPDLQITLFQNSPTRKPFDNLSNSMSPIRPNRSNISPVKRSDDSLFGFSVLSDSEDKENSPVVSKIANKQKLKRPDKKQTQSDFKTNEPDFKTNKPDFKTNEPDDISIQLFEDLHDVKHNKKRFSRQYTRPQTKRKRNVSFKICSDDSDSETETHHFKKKQKDVLTKKEAEEAERLASHYNSYFEEIENYPLCIE